MKPTVFISYRRQDTAAEAGRIQSAISQKLKAPAVFMDSSSIQPGTAWPTGIQDALRDAPIVVVVVGPDWVRASDQWGKRRIDQDDDWVRQEVAAALAAEGKTVIPVLVRGAVLPPPEALPEPLRDLVHRQAIDVRTAYWDHDIHLLLGQIVPRPQSAAGQPGVSDPYPRNPPEGPDPISDEKLQVYLTTELVRWKKKVSPLPEDPDRVRVELYREYRFKTFREAIGFMAQVAPGCDIAIHHPRWENVWKTVRVYLSTWDIGHRISDRDIQLARYFDHAYGEYPGADPKT
jgi:pterin-4a-carbinolamine dehydratase